MFDPQRFQKIAELSSREFFRRFRQNLRGGKEISQDLINARVLGWLKHHPPGETSRFLPKFASELAARKSVQSAWNLMSFLEVALNLRRPRVGIFDHAFHYIGGAQKYGATIAQSLQDDCEVTLLANKPVAIADLQTWYGVDLSRCRLKIIPLPFFEQEGHHPQIIDVGKVDTSGENPFHAVGRESGDYDVFVNNSMLEMVYPLANTSLFICHFPEREKSRFFYADRYAEIVYNSLYTARWIEKRWNIHPHKHIYPPVDMIPAVFPLKKENIVLSVSRFDIGGNKQQLEMVKMFHKLARSHPQEVAGWRLVLVGGSPPENPYLEKIQDYLRGIETARIELQVNIPASALRSVYEKAKIFWHLCGLNQSDPAKVEHFGMTVAEAMQNGCVPVVFRGGGQMEIVEPGVSGFLFSSEKELFDATLALMRNAGELEKIGGRAHQRGKRFGQDVFISTVRNYFRELIADRFSDALSR